MRCREASATIEPNQSYTFTATVTKNDPAHSAPGKDIPVSVTVQVDAISGGHDHGEKPIEGVIYKRPKGTLSTSSGNTSFPVTFTATDVSGTHAFTAQCDKCQGDATATLDVKVEGLEAIPASAFYALTEDNGDVIGARTGNHTENHFLAPDALAVLWRIAAAFRSEKRFSHIDPATNQQLVLHLNDASLKLGGVFDICAIPDACSPDIGVITWDEPHTEHRRGTVVDVRANNKSGAIPSSFTRDFKALARYYGADPHLEGGSTRHFHLRLLNRRE